MSFFFQQKCSSLSLQTNDNWETEELINCLNFSISSPFVAAYNPLKYSNFRLKIVNSACTQKGGSMGFRDVFPLAHGKPKSAASALILHSHKASSRRWQLFLESPSVRREERRGARSGFSHSSSVFIEKVAVSVLVETHLPVTVPFNPSFYTWHLRALLNFSCKYT